VRQFRDLRNFRGQRADRNAASQQIFVPVQEFDRRIFEDVRLTKQSVPVLAFRIRKREVRVLCEICFSVDDERLTRRALTFFATVRERETLTKSCVEDGLSTSISISTGSNFTRCRSAMAILPGISKGMPTAKRRRHP